MIRPSDEEKAHQSYEPRQRPNRVITTLERTRSSGPPIGTQAVADIVVAVTAEAAVNTTVPATNC